VHRGELVRQVEWLPDFDRLKELARPLRRQKPFKEQLIDLIADRALAPFDRLPRSAEQFDHIQIRAGERIPLAVQESLSVVAPLLEAHAEVAAQLDRTRLVLREASAADMNEQLEELLPEEFLVETPWEWLQHVPRYLRGIALRVEKIRSGHADRDERLTEELQPHLARLREFLHRMGAEAARDPQVEHYHWMLQEYRVSLFAQELGTSLKVSPQRLERQWGEVET
jgi:ATP-dependent helicase HrpA